MSGVEVSNGIREDMSCELEQIIVEGEAKLPLQGGRNLGHVASPVVYGD